MKNKSLLEFEDEKKLYEKFSVDTLESLDTLFYYVLDEKTPISFNIVFQKKYDENADNYNGREETTEKMLLDNFDISEITNSLKYLSDNEFEVISKPICKAISITIPSETNTKLAQELIEFEQAHQEEIVKRITPIYKDMLQKDIKNLFSKFSIGGLEFFDNILNYVDHERIDDIKRAKNEALENKYKKYKGNVTTISDANKVFNLTQFKSSFPALTDLELEFLYGLVEEAALYLNCIKDYSDYYKDEIEGFDINNYPINEVNEIFTLLRQEKSINRLLEKAPENVEEIKEEKIKTK